jgi:hypothetical protein
MYDWGEKGCHGLPSGLRRIGYRNYMADLTGSERGTRGTRRTVAAASNLHRTNHMREKSVYAMIP